MAAPASKTMADLNGSWHLNKSLSDSVEPVLALQGIGWVTRKAVAAAGLTLNIKEYKAKDEAGTQPDGTWPPAPPATAESLVIHFDQVVSGGLKGTAETRFVNGLIHSHTDWLFGTVDSQNLLKSAEDIVALPDVHLSGRGSQGPWLVEGDQLYTVARSPAGWVASQVWGFQIVDVDGSKQRRFCRNISVTKGSESVQVRFVYDFQGA